MDNNAFASLSREHKFFLEFLELKNTNPSKFYDLNRWKLLAFILEKIHHEKEESFLFPNLIKTDALNAGGIKCATFFTPRVLGTAGWPDSYQELLKSLGAPTRKNAASTPFREKIFAEKNMLTIPIDDHILGAFALEQILLKKDDHQVMNLFAALLRDHIEREEDCLFPLCDKVLTEEQKNIFKVRSGKFDQENQTSSLLEKLMAP